MTPTPPYYAVIFTSQKSAHAEGFDAWDEAMDTLVRQQSGYLGHESYRNPDGESVTISYWKDADSIALWRDNAQHRQAQQYGRQQWYEHYRIRVCRVERDYAFSR